MNKDSNNKNTGTGEIITFDNIPPFEIPPTTPEEIAVTSVGTIRETIFDVAESMIKESDFTTKAIKFSIATSSQIPFTAIDIIMSYKEEGLMQATVTAIAATGITVGLGFIATVGFPAFAATTTGAITIGLFCGLANYGISKILDGTYDYIEGIVSSIQYNETTQQLAINTIVDNLDDIKTIVQPTAEYLKFEDELLINDIIINQTTVDGTNSYTIQYGDSVWDICNRFKLSYEDLINSNPWLADRFDDDLQFCLIKPGEKLLIPFNQDNPQTFLPDSELPEFAQQFNNAAQTDPIYRDPLLIDLNGDGITTTDVNNGIYFDHDVNGFAEKSAWVSNDDGILAFDVNNNGVIDNGSEIFGDAFLKPDGSSAQSGFDALSSLDSNNDNIIDANDSQFNNIKILKADGSLISLAEAGIVSISLNAQASNTVDENGNTQLNVSSFTKADGSTGSLADYTFVRDTLHTQATDIVEVPDDILALPDAQGYGNVLSLHQAMAKDSSGELKTLVQDFVNASSETDKLNLVKQIILKWTGVENIAADSRGEFYNAQELAALEAFMGQGYTGVPEQGTGQTTFPNSQAANVLNAAYTALVEHVYAQLTSQTTLSSIYDMINISVDIKTGEAVIDLTDVTEYISAQIALDKAAGDNLLAEFNRSFIHLGLKDYANYEIFYNEFANIDESYKILLSLSEKTVINGTEGDDSINGGATEDAIFAGSGNDTIYSRQGEDLVYGGDGDDYIDTCQDDDIVFGGNGNDTIIGGYGDDILYGEAGNDTIYAGDFGKTTIIGGTGDDELYSASQNSLGNETTYVYNLGDGNDIIHTGINDDYLQFGEGITKDNVMFSAVGYDLLITFKDSEGSIIVKDNFDHRPFSLIKFADGSTYDFNQVSQLLEIHGTEGDDTVQGSSQSEVIYAYGGNDNIDAGAGDDIIYAGDGDDTINAGYGDDIVYAGNGNDTIYAGDFGKTTIIGGAGDDELYSASQNSLGNETTYVYNLGDGNDIIHTGINDDYIQFGDGITKDSVMFTAVGYDLLITFKNSDGSIIIKDNFDHRPFSLIKFADGSTYDFNQVNSLLALHGTEGDDTIQGSSEGEVIYAYGGNDNIDAGQGDDLIYAGDGDDTINAGYGDDVVYGGNGNDTIYAGDFGKTTIIGGAGDDELYSASQNSRSNETTYVYNLGDGNDIIHTGVNDDYIQFGDGITKDNVMFSAVGYDLLITFKNSDGSIIIKDNFDHRPFSLIKFADGSTYDFNQVNSLLALHGTEGDDTIQGSSQSEVIYAYGGNDNIDAGQGDDIIYAGDGDDTINAGYGDDVVYGGNGNDTIYAGDFGKTTIIGGAGDDELYSASQNSRSNETTYVYNLGDGNDIIHTGINDDYIQFGDGITKDSVMFTAVGYDLLITFKDADGSILVKDFSNRRPVDAINFADGTSYNQNDITSLLTTHGTNENDTLNGSTQSEKIYGYDGDDYIDANSGNDTIYGGNGNDTIYGGSGDNLIYGGDGNDYIEAGSSGHSILIGGNGDDILVGESQNSKASTTTYVYNYGDGNDSIINGYGSNYLELGEGFTNDNVILFLDSQNDSLQIGFLNSDNVIEIDRKNRNAYMDKITLSDGNYLDNNQINQIIQNISAYASDNGIDISSIEDVKNNPDLMNMISSSWMAA